MKFHYIENDVIPPGVSCNQTWPIWIWWGWELKDREINRKKRTAWRFALPASLCFNSVIQCLLQICFISDQQKIMQNNRDKLPNSFRIQCSLNGSPGPLFFLLPPLISPHPPTSTIDQFSLLALRKADNPWDKPGFRSESQYSTVTICQKMQFRHI